MMFGKKSIAFILTFAIAVFAFSYASYANLNPEIYVDGNILTSAEGPFIENGRTYVPLRAVGESLGAQITWDEEKHVATALKNDILTEFSVSEKAIFQNGERVDVESHPVIVKDRMYVPLRAVAEGFGYTVSYDGRRGIINISSGALLKVHFMDAGQADSSFVELPDGKCMLIDAGLKEFGTPLTKFIKGLGYNKIDYVVATHPHSDHIGGMAEIIASFEVGAFYMVDRTHTSKAYENMLIALEKNGCKTQIIRQGDTLFDSIIKCVVLAPQEGEFVKINNYSAVLKLTYKDLDILFAADAEIDSEESMLSKGLDLNADVLKVGHHGSDTSSTDGFINRVMPSAAVISVGKKNEYGFPSPLVLDLFEKNNIKVYRTDTDGTITLQSDGFVYTME